MEQFKTNFDIVSSLIKVIDIAEPCISVLPYDTTECAWQSMMESENGAWFCLIRDSGQIYGYIALDDEKLENFDCLVGTVASPITVDIIVSATMPVLDLIPIFARKSRYLFVLDQNDVNHIVTFSDLDKLPVKICIFSLFMELEAELIEVFSGQTKKYLAYLPKKRLEKASELCQMKYGKMGSDYKLLLCTTFIDKKTMLVSDPLLPQIFPLTKSELNHFFVRVEKVRNRIAHSDSIIDVLKTPQEFDEFLIDLRKVINTLRLFEQYNTP